MINENRPSLTGCRKNASNYQNAAVIILSMYTVSICCAAGMCVFLSQVMIAQLSNSITLILYGLSMVVLCDVRHYNLLNIIWLPAYGLL